MLEYPNKLNVIFDKLNNYSSKIIIIGGFVRDYFLEINSKDIDIEVYGISSYEELESILMEFGSVNSIGKSFGICKLDFEGYDLDFSLPRKDSKIGLGYTGFDVTIDSTLDFKTATSRRDFTINAIGYDVIEKKILDPFNGVYDIKTKTLRAVDSTKFGEDPLRVLRLVQFYARFEFKIENNLYTLCSTLVKEGKLRELPNERIFTEIKKLLLKANKPSIGLNLLNDLNIDLFEINNLKLISIDYFISFKTNNDKTNLIILLSLIYKDSKLTLEKLTDSKTLKREINRLIHIGNYFENKSKSILYNEAKEVDINILELYLKALKAENEELLKVIKPHIHGKDLIQQGMIPSKEFSNILQELYTKQLIF